MRLYWKGEDSFLLQGWPASGYGVFGGDNAKTVRYPHGPSVGPGQILCGRDR